MYNYEPPSTGGNDEYQIWGALVCVVLIILGIIFSKYGIANRFSAMFKGRREQSNNDAFIMAYYTLGHGLMQVAKGKLESMRYMAFLTTSLPLNSGPRDQFTEPGAVIYTLQLPFHTQGHIIGLSKKYDFDRVFLASYLSSNGLEPVYLEGNFPDLFSLFAGKGQQVQTRYILDPAAMAFVVDYCTNYFWEIAGDEMYFVAPANQKGKMDALKDSKRFVKEIRPALMHNLPGDEPVQHDASYGDYDGGELPCPICSAPMQVKPEWLECTSHHGILINGRYVIQIREKQLTAPETIMDPVKHGEITCPNCHTKMEPVNYQGSGVIIDSCTKCPFRWLDANEASKIVSKV